MRIVGWVARSQEGGYSREVASATLRTVALAAGVHPSTVSRALDPFHCDMVKSETRERVQRVAAEVGYSPDGVAVSLRLGRTNTIGVIISDLANPLVATVVAGIEKGLRGHDLMVLMAETSDDSERLLKVVDNFIGRRVDAIISLAARKGDEDLMSRASKRVPVILAVRNLSGGIFSAVINDDTLGGEIAARHLLELGHRRVGQLQGPSFISCFVDRGLAFDRFTISNGGTLVTTPSGPQAASVEGGYLAAISIFGSGEELPTAIFAHNDMMALGALRALEEAGLRCPEDISIIGYNDLEISSHCRPSLTTVHLPAFEVGVAAATVAVTKMSTIKTETTVHAMVPRLVARSSTYPPQVPTPR